MSGGARQIWVPKLGVWDKGSHVAFFRAESESEPGQAVPMRHRSAPQIHDAMAAIANHTMSYPTETPDRNPIKNGFQLGFKKLSWP